jgi:hypothetical protein
VMTPLDHAPAAPRREPAALDEFHRCVSRGVPWPTALERAVDGRASAPIS